MTKFTVSERFDAPVSIANLHTFILGVPSESTNATVDVSTIMGGDQRDPVATAYIFTARWEK